MQASVSTDSSAAETTATTGMWRFCSSLPTAAFVIFPTSTPGRTETVPQVTVICNADDLTVRFTEPRDFLFHQWVPPSPVYKHQRTRRIASTSRWVGRGCTGTAHLFLWAEGRAPPWGLGFVRGQHCRAETLTLSPHFMSGALPQDIPQAEGQPPASTRHSWSQPSGETLLQAPTRQGSWPSGSSVARAL